MQIQSSLGHPWCLSECHTQSKGVTLAPVDSTKATMLMVSISLFKHLILWEAVTDIYPPPWAGFSSASSHISLSAHHIVIIIRWELIISVTQDLIHLKVNVCCRWMGDLCENRDDIVGIVSVGNWICMLWKRLKPGFVLTKMDSEHFLHYASPVHFPWSEFLTQWGLVSKTDAFVS